MLTSHDQRIDALLSAQIVEPHVAPGACAAVCYRQADAWVTLAGSSGQLAHDDVRPTTSATRFDLASLTKPIVAFCLARYADRHLLDRDEVLCRYLPWTAELAAGSMPLDRLLGHRSGLRSHVELYAPLRDGAHFESDVALRVAAHSLATERRALPGGGFEVIYSDLGFILLGRALESIARAPLASVIHEELTAVGVRGIGAADVLGLADDGSVAPTETVSWRGGRVVAVVHDENAFALSGRGCSGHAGLFGTLDGVVGFAQLMLDVRAGRRSELTSEGIDWLLAERPGGSHRGGFDGKAATGSSVGHVLSSETFGHLGFTGTSLWCDPTNDVAVVLLTNRVCPSRDNISIRKARPLVHDALARLGMLRTTGQ